MAENSAWTGIGGETAEERLFVRFHMGAILDGAETHKQGYPRYKDVPFVTIAVPGDKSLVIDRQVWDDENNPRSDTQRFARAWAAFKAGHGDEVTSGTPLSEWAPVTRAQVEELGHWRIRTVEQLAGLSDANCQKFLGSIMLREKAKSWLQDAAKEQPLQAMREEMGLKSQELSQLKDELASLKAAMTSTETASPAAALRAAAAEPKRKTG